MQKQKRKKIEENYYSYQIVSGPDELKYILNWRQFRGSV